MTVGSKIVYPSQGPCLIKAIVQKTIAERPLMFYQLLVLNDGGGELFIPVEKVGTVGIRLLLNRSEIPKLMGRLSQPAATAANHRARSLHILDLFASGSAFDLAEVVSSLTELHASKPLSFREHKALERAKGLLVCEIAEVMGITREVTMGHIEVALAALAAAARPLRVVHSAAGSGK
ncbi:MAG TPA: CarD family transcriptional regulator [Blastocatellia bacterium]|nr:CarD family transcriptional regulator [Blastocatellia bacterium]